MARKAFNGGELLNATLEDTNITSVETNPPVLTLISQDRTTYTELLEATDITYTVFAGTLGKGSIRYSSITIMAGSVVATDDGDGAFTGTGVTSGTVDYTTGAVSITFDAGVSDPLNVRASYKAARPALGGEYVAGTATFPEWTAEGLVELFGFEPQEIHTYETVGDVSIPQTQIRYRISVDGGTTYKYWNGLEWATVSSTEDWNDWVTVDREISELEFDSSYGSKSITLRVKLIPYIDTSTNTYYTPKLAGVNIYHELLYEFDTDILRAVGRFCRDNVKVLESQVTKLGIGDDEITLTVNDDQSAPRSTSNRHSVNFSAPTAGIKIYDLTNDPGRTTELAFTFDGTDLITLTTPLVSAAFIEVQYESTIPYYVSAEESLETSTSRAILAFVDTSVTNDLFKGRPQYTEAEPDFSNRQVRLRVPTQIQDFRATFMFQSPHMRQTSAMVSAFKRAIDQQPRILSPATGQYFEILKETVIENQSSEAEGLEVKTFTLDIRGKVFYPDYTTLKLVKEVNVPIGNTQAPLFTFANIVIGESDVAAFDGADAEMAYIINSPAIEVWDRNGIRSGVYTTISGALASLSTDGGRIVLSTGTYTFSSVLTVAKNKVTIEGCGPDTTLALSNTSSIGLINSSGSDFVLKNLRVLAATVTDDQVLIRTTGNNPVVENVLFEVTGATGSDSNPSILLDFGNGADAYYGGVVRNCKFIPNAGITCFRSRKGSELICRNNKVYVVSGSGGKVYRGFDLTEEDNFSIQENKFINVGLASFPINKCILLTTCSFGTVVRNMFQPVNILNALSVLGSNNVLVDGNIFRDITAIDTSGHIVVIDADATPTDSSNIYFTNNIFDGCGASAKYSLSLDNTDNVSVTNNQFLSAQSIPITVAATNVTTFTLANNLFVDGISLSLIITYGATAADWFMFGNVAKGFAGVPPWTAPGTGSFSAPTGSNQYWA